MRGWKGGGDSPTAKLCLAGLCSVQTQAGLPAMVSSDLSFSKKPWLSRSQAVLSRLQPRL